MSPKAQKLLDDVLRLSIRDRADLATKVIRSLVAEDEAEIEASWDAEIARRVKDLDKGTAETVPWSEVRKRLRASLDESS